MADPKRTFVLRGKGALDKKVGGYNRAAHHGAWLVLRDADHDQDGCVAAVREALVAARDQSDSLCLRLPVRALEAWLLADTEAFAREFSVPESKVPIDVESLVNPKAALVNLCRASRKKAVRLGVVPPIAAAGTVGPEYATFLIAYCQDAWRPNVAARNAPSLMRALYEIDRLVADGVWL